MDDESHEIAEYRSVSGVAVATLVLGLASVVCLVWEPLAAVPLLAIAFGLIGIQQTGADGKVGRIPAILGISLAVLFLSCATTRYVYRRSLLYDEASEKGKAWLQMIADGNRNAAHQLTLPPLRRASQKFTLNEYYANNGEMRDERNRFFREAPLAELWAQAGKKQIKAIRFVRDLNQMRIDGKDNIQQLFVVELEQDKKISVILQLMRMHEVSEGRCHWEVGGVIDGSQM